MKNLYAADSGFNITRKFYLIEPAGHLMRKGDTCLEGRDGIKTNDLYLKT
jgi:hypothetical protein